MAITYANLFAPLGQIIGKTNIYDSYITDLATYQAEILSTLDAQAAQHLMDDVPKAYQNFQTTITGWIANLKIYADRILTHPATVTSHLPIGDVSGAQEVIPHLRRDMIANSQTVLQCTVTIGSVTYTLENTASVKIITTLLLDGVSSPASYAPVNPDYAGVTSQLAQDSQTISMICTSDSESGSVARGAEVFSVVGNPGNGSYNRLPEGLGETVGVVGNSAGATIVANGQFEDWTAGPLATPLNWTVVDGLADTEFEEEPNGLRGTSSFKVLAGVVDVELTQVIDSDDLVRRKAYALIALVFKSGTTGVIEVELMEGVAEQAAVTIDMSTAAAGWSLLSDFFIVPEEIGTDWTLRVTALGTFDGTPLIDDVLIVPVTYVNGIGYVLVAIDEKIILGDEIEFAVSNNNAGVIQTYFRRTYGAQLPSASSSPTITEAYATGVVVAPSAATATTSAIAPTVVIA